MRDESSGLKVGLGVRVHQVCAQRGITRFAEKGIQGLGFRGWGFGGGGSLTLAGRTDDETCTCACARQSVECFERVESVPGSANPWERPIRNPNAHATQRAGGCHHVPNPKILNRRSDRGPSILNLRSNRTPKPNTQTLYRGTSLIRKRPPP